MNAWEDGAGCTHAAALEMISSSFATRVKSTLPALENLTQASKNLNWACVSRGILKLLLWYVVTGWFKFWVRVELVGREEERRGRATGAVPNL